MDGIEKFMPNVKMHNEFAVALNEADKSGVKIFAYNCKVTCDSIKINRKVSVIL